MYVCVCNAVTERQIVEAVEEGANTLKDLRDELGVASECGSCVSCAKSCLKDAKKAKQSQQTVAPIAFSKPLIQQSPSNLGVA